MPDHVTSHGPGRRRATVRQRARALVERFEAGGSRRQAPLDRPTVSDWVLTGLLATIPAISFGLGPNVVADRWHAPVWVGALLLVPQLVPLAWRRVAPHRVMSVVGTATGLYFLLGFTYTFNIVGVLVALYAEAAYGRDRRSGLASLGISLGFVVGLGLLGPAGFSRETLPLYAFNLFVFVTAWTTGDAFRSRRLLADELHARAVDAERSRALETERAVLAEQTRIARELHDLIAHTVSVMVVQAGAGRRVSTVDPARAAAALASVETTGRSALTELRRLVDVLRTGERAPDLAPQPGLDDLPALVATLTEAGVPVRLTRDEGAEAVPRSVDVSAYRIVQEALTNVLRHAGNVRDVQVIVRHTVDHLELEVIDDGRGASTLGGGAGTGLIGMRERVALFGGGVHAGPRRGGGFRVHAHLPLDPSDGPLADDALLPTGA